MAGAANIIERLEAKLEERQDDKYKNYRLEKRKWLAAKTIFGLCLFMFYIWMFGQPALEKYQAESVITLEKEIDHGFKYPTVTVCPSDSDGSKRKGKNIYI